MCRFLSANRTAWRQRPEHNIISQSDESALPSDVVYLYLIILCVHTLWRQRPEERKRSRNGFHLHGTYITGRACVMAPWMINHVRPRWAIPLSCTSVSARKAHQSADAVNTYPLCADHPLANGSLRFCARLRATNNTVIRVSVK